MKSHQLLLLFIILGCNKPISKNKELTNVLNNYELPIRGNIINIGIDNYRLDYYDVYEKDSQTNYLKSKGFQGGGQSWSGIIYGAIKLSDPNILDHIRFDEEADGIAIWSTQKNSLEKISHL